MTFVEAVKSVYSNYVNFQGRAERSEFWWFVLFYFVAVIVLSLIDGALDSGGILYGLFLLGTILPYLAVSVRRLHDTGKSGWWILLSLVPIVGVIVLIIFYVQKSEPGANKFGPSPVGTAEVPPEPV